VSPSNVTGVYVEMLLGVAVGYLLLRIFWSDRVLLGIDDLWNHGLVLAGLGRVWFIFAWAFGTTMLMLLIAGNSYLSYYGKGKLTLRGLWLSLNAGVFEELIFRWVVFSVAMIILPFVNWLTFGLVHWFYYHTLVPLANLTTFHALDPYLHYHSSWVVGAAIVSASATFRDRHAYLGLLGWVNAWFLGMVMFWLVLNYGLLTAIVAHALYDAIIFTIVALTTQSHSLRFAPVRGA
jgi:hypothetical protein